MLGKHIEDKCSRRVMVEFNLKLLFNEAVNYIDCIASKMDELMSMNHWWNGAEREKRKHSEKNLFAGPRCTQKSHIKWPGIVAGLPQ
jgi:hypothetical protein